jgi:PAS domain S-box-containing protein
VSEVIRSVRGDDGQPAFVDGTILDITERKRAEESLRFTQFTVDHTADAAFWIDRDARFLHVNESACASLGYTKEELLTMSVPDIAPNLSWDAWPDRWQRLGEVGMLAYESCHRSKDGHVFPVEITANSFVFEGKRYICAFARDITERKLNEDLTTAQLGLLKAANEKGVLPALLEQCLGNAIRLSGLDSGGIYLRDPADQSLILACHDGLSEKFVSAVARVGLDSPKYQVIVEGRAVYQVYDELGVPADDASRAEGLQAIAVLPLLHRGEIVGCLNVASHALQAVPKRARIVLETIAALIGGIIARSETERNLTESEQRLTRVIETSPVGIIIVDRSGTIAFANAAAEGILGLSRSEIAGRKYNAPEWSITDYEGGPFPDEELPFRRVMETGLSVQNVRHAIEHPDGRRVFLSINASPLFDEKGNLDGMVASLSDVTDTVLGERAVERRIATERFINETSARLLELAALDIEQGVDQELALLARFIGVDRAFILEATSPAESFRMTHEWCTEGVEPVLSRNQELRAGEYRWLMEQIRSQGFIRITSHEALPSEAAPEKEAMKRDGVRSFLAIPMSHRGNMLGLLGWVTTRCERVWSDDDVLTIDLTAHALAAAIAIQRADNALRDSETRLSSIFRAAPVGIGLVRDRILLQVNDQICEMVGRSVDELIGQSARILYPTQEDYDFVGREKYRQITERGTGSVETRWVRKDGTVLDVLLSSTPFDTKDLSRGVTFTAVDITARNRAEHALRQERDRAETYLEIAAVMFVVLDVDGRVSMINRKGCEILGHEAHEIVGQNWVKRFVPERLRETVHAAFDQLLRGEIKPVEHSENPVVSSSGEERVISWHNTVLRDAGGRIVGTLSSGEDVTEHRRIEEERASFEIKLRQQQKLESIGTLAAGVAHEINNPINGIMNYAQLIANRLPEDDKLRTFASRIVGESERVSAIVRDLLAFSRQERWAHSPARLQDIVAATVGLVRAAMRKDRIALDVDVPEDLPLIKCRSQQIQQVLLNMLTNARDALEERYAAGSPEKRIRVHARRLEKDGRAWIRTTVEDFGGGIPPEIGERVFDPFFTTKSREKGTGLGLSVSYGIAKDHHGALWFESEPGSGTRFHLDLPLDNGWTLEESPS